MTKQRFTMTANTKAVKEYDSGFRDSMNAHSRNIHGRLSYQEVVDLLNSLSEENEQLKSTKKKRLDRLHHQRESLFKQQEAIIGYKGDIKQLRKENEQLKKQNENLLAKLKFTAEQVNYSENLRKMLEGDVE